MDKPWEKGQPLSNAAAVVAAGAVDWQARRKEGFIESSHNYLIYKERSPLYHVDRMFNFAVLNFTGKKCRIPPSLNKDNWCNALQ